MRDQTADLLRAKQALSQLSYSPVGVVRTSTFDSFPARHSETKYGSMRAYPQQSTGANMAGLSGLEPPTSPLSEVRSNHLSYKPVEVLLLVFIRQFCEHFKVPFKVRR